MKRKGDATFQEGGDDRVFTSRELSGRRTLRRMEKTLNTLMQKEEWDFTATGASENQLLVHQVIVVAQVSVAVPCGLGPGRKEAWQADWGNRKGRHGEEGSLGGDLDLPS